MADRPTPTPTPTQALSAATALAIVGSALALVVGVVAVVRSGDASATPGGGAASETVLEVSLTEFAVTPAGLSAEPGRVALTVTNDGAVEHDLTLRGGDGAATPMLASGEGARLDLGPLDAGTYELFCSVPGHADAGMTATLTVAADSHGGDGGDGGGHGHSGDTDWAALDAAMIESILAFPAETAGVGNQVLEPTVLPDGTKEFELTAAITDWEVEPGKVVQAWTYNGQVPGPIIKVGVGEKVRVVVHNELPMGTDVHWHGVRTPNDQDGVAPITQPLIESGDTYTYEFTTEAPAVGMYHAHHHAQMAVVNGMLGAFLIGDVALPHGRTISGFALPERIELADEVPLVLNDAGVIGYSLNGKSFPATAPFVQQRGDWVLVHYMNEGLQIHPMHLHQMRQLVVAKDGIPLDQPYYADTVNVAPGERYSVLIHADSPGTWVWHCHILTHVERDEGMFGMVTAMVVQ